MQLPGIGEVSDLMRAMISSQLWIGWSDFRELRRYQCLICLASSMLCLQAY